MKCVFCRIIRGEQPGDIVYQDDSVTAFRDAHPQASTHILIVPNKHIRSANDLLPEDESILVRVFSVARLLAEQEQIQDSGYRLVVNNGPDAGQSIMHLHLHLIGGRRMIMQMA
jgi:histidine triad (HIT) family protein